MIERKGGRGWKKPHVKAIKEGETGERKIHRLMREIGKGARVKFENEKRMFAFSVIFEDK